MTRRCARHEEGDADPPWELGGLIACKAVLVPARAGLSCEVGAKASGVGVVALDVGGTGDVDGLDLDDPVRARTVEASEHQIGGVL